MSKKLFLIGVIFSLLVVAGATPFSVQAEGDPPPNPEPVSPPWITGINPNVSLSNENGGDLSPAGVANLAAGVEVPLLAAPPDYVDLVPQESVPPPLSMYPLAVPQRYQDPLDNTCGAAALGMALEFLSLNRDGSAPSQAALIAGLKNSGLLYKTGTGVEELAFLARQHGYLGTSAFHDWTLAQLKEQLENGKPVVVSLGSNGENQPGHFVTLTGISDDGQWVSFNDPVLGKQTIPADDFVQSWNLQGNSGLLVQKEPLSTLNDPMLPWMGLFSALTVLAVMAKQYPIGEELRGTLAGIRSVLSNPARKGIGGRLSRGGGSRSKPRKLSSRSRKSKPKPKPRPKRKAKPKSISRPRPKAKSKPKPKPKPKPRPTPRHAARRSAPPRRPAPRPAPPKPSPKPSLFSKVKSAVMSVAKKAKTVVSNASKQAGSAITNAVNTATASINRTVRKIVPVLPAPMAFKPNLGTAVAASGAASWRGQAIPQAKPLKKSLFSRISKTVAGVANSVKRSISTAADSVRNKADTILNRFRTNVNRFRTGVSEKLSAVAEVTKTIPKWMPVGAEGRWEQEEEPTPTPTPTPYPTSTPAPVPVPTPVATPSQEIKGFGAFPWTDFLTKTAEVVTPIITSVNTIKEKVIEPIETTVLSSQWWYDKFSELPTSPKPAFFDQQVLSLSASKEWDLNLFSQEGVIAHSYAPPNILSMFYAAQDLNIGQKEKVTSNPGSFLDIDVTSGTYTLNPTKNLSIYSSIKGGGVTLGVGIKESNITLISDYDVNKHSVSATWRGLSYTARQETVFRVDELSSEEMETQIITTQKCDTKTIKTEGILVAALAATGISEAGAIAAPAIPVITTTLNTIWEYIQSGLGPLLNPGILP